MEKVVTDLEFEELVKKAKELGAESFNYSTRKNNKYMVKLPDGKKIHFGSPNFWAINLLW